MVSRSHRGSRATAARARTENDGRVATRTSIARALHAHEHRSAALLLGLLVLAYLWPALVGGHMLSPTALVYLEAPWQAVAPHGSTRWVNGDMGDVPYAYYVWDVLARRFLHAGTFPAWNPYAFAGTPLFANVQIAWLSPFSLPLWLLPLQYGLGVAAALKLWAAGFGTYLLTRELRLGLWPALLAGAAFALCSFNVTWLSFGVFVSVAAMLPWALWLVERIVQGRGRASGPALAAVLAVALTGGHPGTQVHLLAAVGLYATMRTLTVREADWTTRGTRLAIVCGGGGLALLLTAVVLLPAARAATDTWGALLRANGAGVFSGAHIPIRAALTALFPDWWGRPGDGLLADHGPAAYRERTFFAGAATLVLAFVALLSAGAWRRKAPFAALGALGLAIALRMPGLYELVIGLPAFDRVQNSRIYLWFVLALAVLAGFGLQRVIDTRGRIRQAWAAPAAALLAGVVAVALLHPGGTAWSAAIDHALGRTTPKDDTAVALASTLWWLLPVLALTTLLLVARRARHRTGLLAGVAVLLVALEMLHFAHGVQPMGPSDVLTPPPTPAIAFLQEHRDAGRIASMLALRPDTATLYGLHDVGGYDAPQPSRRFVRLWQLSDPSSEAASLNQLTELAPRVLGLLGARYVVMPPKVDISADVPLRTVYEGADATVVENRLVAPRAFVASAAHVAPDETAEIARVAEERFDPRREAVLRANEVGDRRWPGRAAGSARVVGERNDAVTLRATLNRPGIVVLGDAWAPGWTVTVDGHPTPPLQANVVLRGAAVPAGTHEIAWTYRVPGLRLGAALSGLGVVILLGWLAVVAARARRAQAPAAPG